MKALYAGSFDPVTLGHIDIIKRAAKLCGGLTVAVVTNPNKKAMFTAEERMQMIAESCADVKKLEIMAYDGLLADLVLDEGFDMVVRGIRGESDLASEIQMAQINSKLYNGKAETVFLAAEPGHSWISSSAVREVFALGGDISSMVSEETLSFMKDKERG